MAEVAQEAFAFISQASNANFQNEYRNLEQQRDTALLFAGESASAREEIERQFEQKQRAIRRRQFQAEKQMALVKIAIDTAQAVVASIAISPQTFGLPYSAFALAIGAIQAGVVASQQMPAFWKGTDNAPEGMAWTQEKGREIITDKHGKIKSLGSDSGAQMTYLNKGDKVFNASETEAIMFNNDLNNMLLGSGISMPKVEVSMDTAILGQKIDSLSNVIANKDSFTIVKDARGERVYQRKQAQTKELLNNRLTIKGYDV